MRFINRGAVVIVHVNPDVFISAFLLPIQNTLLARVTRQFAINRTYRGIWSDGGPSKCRHGAEYQWDQE
jgi:hypothetical protein